MNKDFVSQEFSSYPLLPFPGGFSSGKQKALALRGQRFNSVKN